MRLTSMFTAAALALIAAPAIAHDHKAGKPSASAAGEAETAALLDKAIAGSWRSEANRARDRYRNPKETLLFFGLRPNMTVVEVSPSGGWYTEILAPVLKDGGRYIAAHNNPTGPPAAQKARQAFIDRFQGQPDLFGRIGVTSFGRQNLGDLAAPNSADMVLTFRNVHNWIGAGFAPDAFRAFFTVLKPGGILGVVDHRLPENRPTQPGVAGYSNTGYVKQSDVIRMAQEAGFELVGTSEVNANPKDTADHPEGVWTLPPTLRLGDKDREKYLAIGESDRMTLKFRKPLR